MDQAGTPSPLEVVSCLLQAGGSRARNDATDTTTTAWGIELDRG